MLKRPNLLPVLALAGLAAGCLLPSDHSARLQAVFVDPPAVYLGDTVQLRLRLFNSKTTDTVSPADVVFSVEDTTVLTVDAAGRALGLQAGWTHIYAQPRMADVAPASITLGVSDRIGIDTIAPKVTRVGDTLHLAGWGLNPQVSTLRISGTPAPVRSFTRAVASSANGYGVLTVWVPPGDTTLRITVTHGATVVRDTHAFTVAQEDILEPNDAAPRHLGPLATGIRYPALSLEASPLGTAAHRDWYTFDNEKTQPVTIVLKPAGPSLVDELYVMLTDSLDAAGNPPPTGWMLGNGMSYCRGAWVSGYRGTLDSQILAAESLPAGRYHVLVGTRLPLPAPRAYELRIEPRFRTMATGRIDLSDSYRCPASSNVTDLPHLINPSLSQIYDTTAASIDYPGDVDWWVMQIDTTRLYVSLHAIRILAWPKGLGEGTVFPRPLIVEVFTFAGQHVGGGATDVGPGGTTWNPVFCVPAAGRYLVSVSDGGYGPVRYFIVGVDNGPNDPGWWVAGGHIPCPAPAPPQGRTPP